MGANWSGIRRTGAKTSRRTMLLATQVAVLAVVACAVGGRVGERSILEATAIPGQSADFLGVAWIDEDRLAVAYNPEGLIGGESELWQLRTDGTGFQPLTATTDPRCTRLDDTDPARLPDGRIGFVRTCALRERTTETTEHHLMAYDSGLGAPVRLADAGCYVSQYSWDPGGTVAAFSCGSRICQGVALVSADGVEPIGMVVREGDHAFDLAGHFKDESDCSATGRADFPAWRPDGEQVAFFASPRSVGVDGHARLDERWNLYLMPPDSGQFTELLTDIKEPRSLAWSPDGSSLAFAAEPSEDGGKTWLFAPTTGDLALISEDDLRSLSWAPAGDRIVAIRDPGTSREWDDMHLVVLD